jgi:hypothetical protein
VFDLVADLEAFAGCRGSRRLLRSASAWAA